MIAKLASIISAKRTVCFARPVGATRPHPRLWTDIAEVRRESCNAVMWSTGIVKKPWI
jgi:hypothetical protein